MCLRIKDTQKRDVNNFAIPNVAKKDIKCYKWLDRDSNYLLTPYLRTGVKIGQRMKVSELGIGTYYVSQGIHAYTTLKTALSRVGYNLVVEAIIPKGAQYIKGIDGDIVATEMKLTRILYEEGKPYKRRKK